MIKKEFFLNKGFIVFVNSIIFTLAFNSPIIIQRYMNYEAAGGDKAFYLALTEAIFNTMFIAPMIYALSGKRFIWKIMLFLIYVISGLAAYFVYTLNISITSEIIASFFEASQKELSDFISIGLILAIITSVLLALICIKLHKISYSNKEKDKRITFICVVFVIGTIIGDGDWINNIMPYNLIKGSSSYFLDKASITKKRIDISKQYEHTIDKKDEDLNIVLIIGESARGDHFSLSGYEKKTNPLLEQEGNNLIYFKNVTSCYPLTRVAVPCMITRGTKENISSSRKETSFISVLKSLGFYTTWLGMQGTYTVIDAPYFDLAKESHKSLLVGTDVDMFSSDDSSLFPFIKQFFQEHQTGKNLLTLHTYGSHFHYEERYTDEFRKFTPTCFKKQFLTDMNHCSNEERINSYDNSILYTDYFIKKTIDHLRDKNAIVIYSSDHGESLGEGGRFLHGTHNADEQIAVNMIFWVSDKYIQLHPEYVNNLHKIKNKKISHNNLFHSILGCGGVKSEVIDKNLNLCNEVHE
ncbi:MAG: sulfatase-like hydrolase/transferase [Rickettsiales bacterium]|nr:sulfatase-like hydrolase/transferase [Rickettsiales bacterium]